MKFEDIIHYRRSVRHYKNLAIDSEKVKHCLELAALSPNSSNMQLWEFYHITNPDMIKKLAVACLNQQAAATAQELVVFVTRQDLYRKRARKMTELESQNVLKNSPKEKQGKRIQKWELYYGKVMPFLYSRFLGILGIFRKLIVSLIGLFRPIKYQKTT